MQHAMQHEMGGAVREKSIIRWNWIRKKGLLIFNVIGNNKKAPDGGANGICGLIFNLKSSFLGLFLQESWEAIACKSYPYSRKLSQNIWLDIHCVQSLQ
jgi:hypothetical protein